MLVVKLKTCAVHSHDYFSRSDTYCVVKFQDIEKTTAVVDDCNTPDFGDTAIFVFPVDNNKDFRVFIDVYDQDALGSDHISSDSFEVHQSAGWISQTINSVNLHYAFVEMNTNSDIENIKENHVQTLKEDLKVKLDSLVNSIRELRYSL